MNLFNEEELNKWIDLKIQERLKHVDEQKSLKQLSVLWDMDDLERELKHSRKWITDLLNYPPFKKELESFVFYPKFNREGYSIKAKQMSEWIDKNFNRIYETKSEWRITK
ncbi:DUF771 domain-containing protein [Mammaliicoccus sciuri]|uniref:DUF771 domain-containing protein n=1 Tax=Mammaliicoccus sciuri TaxID=1296 RepID=UPI002DBF635F|nr:DUF771 domain-containing protein [Mammaliicoccus sciuri]MEB6263646.1 DUF771 domain-containing protein [Mammaliicoccus sciuri]